MKKLLMLFVLTMLLTTLISMTGCEPTPTRQQTILAIGETGTIDNWEVTLHSAMSTDFIETAEHFPTIFANDG